MRKALMLLILAAAAFADDAQTAFDALKKEYSAAKEEFYRPLREAQAKGEEFQLDNAKNPRWVYATRFAAFAAEHPKTDAAAQALVMTIQLASAETMRKEAARTLLRDHMDSAALKEVIYAFKDDDLKLIAEKSPYDDVKGPALLLLGILSAEKGKETEALAIFRKVKEKYADVRWYRGTLGKRADGGIFQIERLGIGKVAPDIEGVDLDGKPLKLSDFRGKVVVLDFWGDW